MYAIRSYYDFLIIDHPWTGFAARTQVVSAIYKEGVEVIGWMINELETWMQRRGFNSIADFKGRLSQGKAVNPHQFERVQFVITSYSIHYTKLYDDCFPLFDCFLLLL